MLTLTKGKNAILVGKSGKESIYFDRDAKDGKKSITMEENIDFYPYLDLKHNQRSFGYIASISGSGKSVLTCEIIKRLRKLRGKGEDGKPRKVVIFSIAQSIDPCYEGLSNFAWVPLSHPEFPKITLEDLRDNIVILDDHTSVIDSKLKKYTMGFIQQMSENSRKLGIDMINIAHQIQASHQSKATIFEADWYALNFNTAYNASMKFLKSYMDFDKEEMAMLKKFVDSSNNAFNFTFLRKSYPRLICFQNKIRLI